MSLTAIIANTIAVTKLVTTSATDSTLLFRECDHRRPIEKQPEMGSDGQFEVVASQGMTDVLERDGAGDTIRNVVLTVRCAFWKGGGDAGQGDGYSTNIRANDAMVRLCGFLENPERYDAQNTELRRRNMRPWAQSFDSDKVEVWDASFNCEWEQVEDVRAVA